MDALPFITDMLSEPVLRDFLSDNVPGYVNYLDLVLIELIKVQSFMKRKIFREYLEDEKQAVIEGLRLTSRKLGNFMREIVQQSSRKQLSSSGSHDLVKDWKETLDFIIGIVVSCNYLKQTEEESELEHKDIDAVINCLDDIKIIENLLLETADSSSCITPNEEKSRAILLMKAFPALGELKESSEMLNFLLELSKELDNLPQLICKACEGQPLALLLIGSLLSLKQRAYDTWNRVKDDLGKIKESNNLATNNHLWHILTYCYDDLPYFLKPCFLYLACYPIGSKIPATSLTELWIAEGFVIPEKEESTEETANKYLEQLVRRYSQYFGKLIISLIT